MRKGRSGADVLFPLPLSIPGEHRLQLGRLLPMA